MDYAELYTQAREAANKAAHEYNATLPPEQQRGLDCGFAWVKVFPARGPFITWCKKNGHGSNGYGGGWEFWYSKLHDIPTQSVTVHEIACNAFAKVLKEAGIAAYSGSRLD